MNASDKQQSCTKEDYITYYYWSHINVTCLYLWSI